MRKRDFLQHLLFAIVLMIAIAFIWNYKTTVPWLLGKLSPAAKPLAGGIILGFILNMPTSILEKRVKKAKATFAANHARGISIFISLLLLIIFVALLITLVLPELISAISIFVSSLRSFAADSHFWNEVDVSDLPIINALFDSADTGILTLADAIDRKINEYTPRIISFTFTALTAMISDLITLFISFVFAVYFVSNKEMLARHIKRLLSLFFKKEKLDFITHTSSLSFEAFSRFLAAQVTEAVIIGVICVVGMILFRFPYAPAISALTGVMALVPIYGAFIGAIVGAFMIAVVSPWKGLFFLLFIIILQQLEGDLIYPRVVGTSTGVPSVYVFIAVTVGGALFGIWGMLFAVPVFSVGFTLIKELAERREEEERKANAERNNK